MNKEWKKSVEYALAPRLVPAIITLTCSLMNIKKINYDIITGLREKNRKIILAFWHGRQFLLTYAHRNMNISIMTSNSKDGDMQTAVISRMGYQTVRGSSSKKGAVQATLQIIEKINQGNIIAFAVDGPGGPGFKVKHGILYVAQKTGSVIVPMSSSAKYKKAFENWDNYLLPMPIPFNKGTVVYGNPMEVGINDNFEKKASELEEELNRITLAADNML